MTGNRFICDEETPTIRITINDMKCKDCIHKMHDTSICTKYEEQKPLTIIRGGECELYEPLAIKD